MNTKEQTILVVEDEMPLLEAIRLKVEKNGFKVLTARSVKEALDHIAKGITINAIWLDHYLLGKENGLDFVLHCKQDNSSCRKIPIFVVSNTASPGKMQTYMKLGVSKYYVKAEKRLDEIIEELKSSLESEAE